MGYSLTFDASHKVKNGGSHRQAFSRHIFRMSDEKAGLKVTHSNVNIEPSRTRMNHDWVLKDGQLNLASGRGSEEVEKALQARLDTVQKKLRKDAVVMRPFIVQLDPQWWADNCSDWKENGVSKQAFDMAVTKPYQWLAQKFGVENIIGMSLHMDEYNPQLQVLFTPVTDDGRLSQKDWFPSPAALRALHSDFREYMASYGYDAEKTVTKRSREHLSSAEYARHADKAQEILRSAAAEAEKITADLDNREHVIRQNEEKLQHKEQNVNTKETALTNREKALNRDLTALRMKQEELRQRKEKYDEEVREGIRVATAQMVEEAQERASQEYLVAYRAMREALDAADKAVTRAGARSGVPQSYAQDWKKAMVVAKKHSINSGNVFQRVREQQIQQSNKALKHDGLTR